MEIYQKIIQETARRILKPHGIIQIGRSRTWLDDQGWFVTQIDFQPLDEGSLLNVGVDFLWSRKPDLDAAFAFAYGGQEPGSADFTGDETAFAAEFAALAEQGLEKALAYRRFRDPEYAKQMLLQKYEQTKPEYRFWEGYDLAMLCFLFGDHADGMTYLRDFMENAAGNFYHPSGLYIAWHEEVLHRCEDLLPALADPQNAQQTVCKMIRQRRALFTARASYRKMQGDPVLPPVTRDLTM